MWLSSFSSSRRRSLPLLAVLFTVAFDTPSAFAAWPNLPYVNVPLSTATADQVDAAAVSDGAGGAIVAWEDLRSGPFADIYAIRVLADGSIAPGWPANGLAVCAVGSNQLDPVLCSDGAGGVIITWTDSRPGTAVFVQRVLGSGTIAPGWTAGGVLVSAQFTFASSPQPTIMEDGSGGAFVAWASDLGPYAQRITAGGTIDVAWPGDGFPLTSSMLPASGTVGLCSDGAGGGYVLFSDTRSGTSLDVFAQRFTGAGAIAGGWAADGVPVCGAVGQQLLPVCVPDGSGGVLASWWDMRAVGGGGFGPGDIYVSRLTSGGALSPTWPVDGLAVCTAVDNQGPPQMVADAGGGAIMTWVDARGVDPALDIYAHHVLPTSAFAAGWAANGNAVSAAAGAQTDVAAISDAAGGIIVAWTDDRATPAGTDIYAARITGGGSVSTGWTSAGSLVSSAAGQQSVPALASDGDHGAIVAWQDARGGNLANEDVYAQRIERWGRLGNPEATITAVTDVPADQGGHVRVDWTASYLDPDPFFQIGEYWIWRQVPITMALARAKGAFPVLDPGPSARPLKGAVYARVEGAQVDYWEFVAARPASGFSTYSYVAETGRDRVQGSDPPTQFMVQARDRSSIAFWNSPTASGYSVDNLAPSMPVPLTGNYATGATHLHWNPNTEPDLFGYRVYRGSSTGFIPGPGNRIGTPSDTGFADPGGAGGYYKLSAVDVHGNESPFALLTPAGTLDAPGGALPSAIALARLTPNPSTGPAVFRLSLPHSITGSLSVYDAAGRRVRSMVRGLLPAGVHDYAWDGRDEAGARTRSGLYFAMLETGGTRLSTRFVTLH